MFPALYSFSFLYVFIEAKWYYSHHNDEAASEKSSDMPKVMKLVNRRQEMPGQREGTGESCDYPPSSVL